MKADISRDTFRPLMHFSRVLKQQGRVELDADWNEQVSILLHYIQTLARDLIGDHAGPGEGFRIDVRDEKPNNFIIKEGHYYVNGILCENGGDVDYFTQPDLKIDKNSLHDPPYLVYLDVWERHITCIQEPSIREVALGGPNTAMRAKIVWQVKATKHANDNTELPETLDIDNMNAFWSPLGLFWEAKLKDWQPANRGQLKAQAGGNTTSTSDPCIISSEARYRGMENQLYRVEIHKSGTAEKATFKWSRENGSVTFTIRMWAGDSVTLEHLGRDKQSSLQTGDWVEVVDDDSVLQGAAGTLLKVHSVDHDSLQVVLDGEGEIFKQYIGKQPLLLRRWDQKESYSDRNKLDGGAVPIKEVDTDQSEWHNLEDGIQIQFQATNNPVNHYRTGDYWLIPARTAIGDIEWPWDYKTDQPAELEPHGVMHHYAPLAFIYEVKTGPKIDVYPLDLRQKIVKCNLIEIMQLVNELIDEKKTLSTK